jgi:hypothetical protein
MKSSKPLTFSVDPEWNNLITLRGRSAYRFFNNLPYADLRTLGVKVIEGECPGSTYFEAELRIPIEEANARAEAAGIDIQFKTRVRRRMKDSEKEEDERVQVTRVPRGTSETFFGGRGIVIPFRFNAPVQNEPAINPDPAMSENPQPPESKVEEEKQP